MMSLRGLGCVVALAPLLWLSGCASVVPDVARPASYATADFASTTVGRLLEEQAAQHPGLSGFHTLASGRTALAMRAALADVAERTIDLQYYSVGDDRTMDVVLLRLTAAAQRGVRVRILLDDLHAPTREFAWRALAADPGIQVRVFNPFWFNGVLGLGRLGEFAFDSARLNRRMHNKLWLTDNAVGIIGSRNLADEYFDANESGNFLDVDLLAAGPVIRDASRAFDEYWNSAAAVPAQALTGTPNGEDGEDVRAELRLGMSACKAEPPCRWVNDRSVLDALLFGNVAFSWGRAHFFNDPPDGDKSPVPATDGEWMNELPLGVQANRELLIVSPYFVPSDAVLRQLREMKARGVRVAVLTNSLASTDATAAHAGYAHHRAELLDIGVELYEVRPVSGPGHRRQHRWTRTRAVSLHAKIIVQDRARSIVGSLNLDPRSQFHNTEAWVTVDSPEIAADLATLFEEGTDPHDVFKVEKGPAGSDGALVWATEEDGKTVRYDTEPMAGYWLRLWRGILEVIVPEHQL